MDEVFAIITVCGMLNGEPDCIRLQQQGPPITQWQCRDKLLEVKIDFELMKLKFDKFKDYVLVEERCEKESLPYGYKPREEST